jgi:hypothetical protein
VALRVLVWVDPVATTGMGDIRVQPWLRAAMDTFPDEVRALGPAIAGGVPGICTGPPGEAFDERARRGCTEPGGDKLSDRREKPSDPAQPLYQHVPALV